MAQSPVMIPIRKIDAYSQYSKAYFGRLKKGFYNPADTTLLDSAYINFQGKFVCKFSIENDSVHYDFLRRLNSLNLSDDVSIVVPIDSAMTYMRRARGKELGPIPSWKVGSHRVDNKDFDVWARTCGNATFSYPEELFLNDFNIEISVANVYESTLGDSCNLLINEYLWYDKDSPSHTILAKNEFGSEAGKYRPKVVNGRPYKEVKTFGDIVQTGPETYYRLDGITARHDSLIVTPVNVTSLPTFALTEAQLNILSPYLSKAKKDGKLLLIDFWGTWCNPCLAGMPHISKLLKLFSNRLCLLGVCVDSPDNFDNARKLLKENDLEGMEVFEPFGKEDGLKNTLEISAFPTYILLKPDGSILFLGTGLPAINSLADLLGSLYSADILNQ